MFQTKIYDQKHAKGLKRNAEEHAKYKLAKAKPGCCAGEAVTLPGKWDLTAKVSPPENQGGCGSCWDFSITKALRSELMLAGKDPGRLAFNYLLNNCGPGDNEYGCGGGDFPAGDNCLNGAGPWLESEDPYRQAEGQCKTGLKVAGTALRWLAVGDGRTPPTFQQLAQAMFNNGKGHVLSVDVAAGGGSWESYSGGIYNEDGGHSIDHMINCVGYDMQTSVDEQGNAMFNAQGQPINGDGYLILMNNWGTQWGEGGYMRSRWGMNAVAETAMYFEVEQPAPKPTVSITLAPGDVAYGDSVKITVVAENAVSVVVNGKVLPAAGGVIEEVASMLGQNPVHATATGADGSSVSATSYYNVVPKPPTPPIPPTPTPGGPSTLTLILVGATAFVVGGLIGFIIAREASK